MFISGKSALTETGNENAGETGVDKSKVNTEEEDAQARLRSLVNDIDHDDDGGSDGSGDGDDGDGDNGGVKTTIKDSNIETHHEEKEMNAGEAILFSGTDDHTENNDLSENVDSDMIVNEELKPSAPPAKPVHQSNGHRSPRVKKMDTNPNISSDEKIRRYNKAEIPAAAKMVTRNKKIQRGMEERAFEKAMNLFMRRVENASIRDRNMAKSIVLKRAQEHNISDNVIARIFDINTQQSDTRLASTLEDD